MRRLVGRPVHRATLSGARILIGRRLLHLLTALAGRGRLARALITLLAGTHVLIGRWLLRANVALAGRRRLRCISLLPGHVREAERCDGSAIDLAGGLEALLPLERDQGLPGARAQHAIGLPDVEPFLDQDHLHLPDLLRAEAQRARPDADLRSAPARVESGTPSSRRAHRHDRDDLATAVDDDDVVTHHEELVPAPFGIDLDKRGMNVDDAHARRHRRAYNDREVHVVDARHVAASKHRLLNPGALLRRQIHSAASLSLLGLALLRLRLLSLILGLGLALLTLLSLRGLPLRMIALPALALALVTRSLTGGLIALTLPPLRGLALLGLALHALITLALLALFSLALRCLTCRLLPARLPLAALGLALLALALHALITLALLHPLATLGSALLVLVLLLVLGASLRLPATILLLPLLRGAALRLGWAARLAAALHVLG